MSNNVKMSAKRSQKNIIKRVKIIQKQKFLKNTKNSKIPFEYLDVSIRQCGSQHEWGKPVNQY